MVQKLHSHQTLKARESVGKGSSKSQHGGDWPPPWPDYQEWHHTERATALSVPPELLPGSSAMTTEDSTWEPRESLCIKQRKCRDWWARGQEARDGGLREVVGGVHVIPDMRKAHMG